MISLTQVPVGALLRRLKLVGFFYVQVTGRNVSNSTVSMTNQQRGRNDILICSRTLKQVTKMVQFLLGTKSVHFFSNLRQFSLINLSMSLTHLKDVGFIQVLVGSHLDVLCCSVPLRYQFVHCYGVSNWLVLSTSQ